jgi:predicted short-subunit dehydrogenase-like oxidoreductase (DUF2520 family)
MNNEYKCLPDHSTYKFASRKRCYLHSANQIQNMNITLIGTGHAANVLGRKCRIAGHAVNQVLSRQVRSAEELASQINASVFGAFDQPILPDTDIVIMAVPDQAIETTAAQLQLNEKATLLHVAGSVSIHVLHKYTPNYGVLYPLQTLRKEAEVIPEIPFLIEANRLDVLNQLRSFALTLSSRVIEAGEEDRQKMHLAAVWTYNFTNHMAAIARQFCIENALDFSLLYPLMQETFRKIQTGNPADHQTGPALRGDLTTQELQLTYLAEHPDWQSLYRLLSSSITTFNGKASQSG